MREHELGVGRRRGLGRRDAGAHQVLGLLPGRRDDRVGQEARIAQEQTRRLPVIVYTSKVLTGEEKKRLTDLAAGLIAKSDVTTSLSPESLLSSLAKMDIAGPEGK